MNKSEEMTLAQFNGEEDFTDKRAQEEKRTWITDKIMTSPAVDQIMLALFEVQKSIEVVNKKTQGFGYKYANLPAVYDMLQPLWAANNLLILHPNTGERGSDDMDLTLWITHVTSGQWIQAMYSRPRVPLSVTSPSPGQKPANELQAEGSVITYLRRYHLVSFFGVATEEDDGKSGGEAMKQNVKAGGQAQPTPPAPQDIPHPQKVITPALPQLAEEALNELRLELMSLILEKGIPVETREEWCNKFKVQSIMEFTLDQIKRCTNYINGLEKK